mmetsp:Transcript_17309/g.48666  ORF Transcript_17309/g.48666 Transcript_17309/m.48666 type:complete len:235 (-) Transcript_17309:1578-2282(-)
MFVGLETEMQGLLAVLHQCRRALLEVWVLRAEADSQGSCGLRLEAAARQGFGHCFERCRLRAFGQVVQEHFRPVRVQSVEGLQSVWGESDGLQVHAEDPGMVVGELLLRHFAEEEWERVLLGLVGGCAGEVFGSEPRVENPGAIPRRRRSQLVEHGGDVLQRVVGAQPEEVLHVGSLRLRSQVVRDEETAAAPPPEGGEALPETGALVRLTPLPDTDGLGSVVLQQVFGVVVDA